MQKTFILPSVLLTVIVVFAISASWESYRTAKSDELTIIDGEPLTPTGSAVLYGMISNTKEDAGTYSLDLRLAEAVSGSDWREQNAIEDGRCTLEMVEQNNCAAYFYTRMTQKTLHIAVDKNVVVTLIDRVDTSKSVPITMNELKERFSKSDFSETPFHITTTQGVITKIQEGLTP